MNYSMHTYEERLDIPPIEIGKIRDWIYTSNIPIKEGERYLSILLYSNNGVRIRFQLDTYKPHIKFIVNLGEVSDPGNLVDLIDAENFDSALEKANEMIESFLGNKYNMSSLKLCRIDLCVNIDVGSQEAVETYIKLLNYKSGSVGGFKIQNINSPNGYCENGFCAENRKESIAIYVYNKMAQLKDINREEEAARAEGILRVETQLKRRSTVKTFFPGFYDDSIVKAAFSHSRETMAYILAKFVAPGDYLKLADAVELVNNNIDKGKMRRRMVRMLELTAKKHNVSLAKAQLFAEDDKLSKTYYQQMMEEFADLNLNVVTLGRKCKFDSLHGLDSFFEQE